VTPSKRLILVTLLAALTAACGSSSSTDHLYDVSTAPARYAWIAQAFAREARAYSYSNPNFMLAGLAAETTSGVPYRQLTHDRIIAPLGMSRTLFRKAHRSRSVPRSPIGSGARPGCAVRKVARSPARSARSSV
jgi:CubicO group peptidase (beta-lactamase class C family)